MELDDNSMISLQKIDYDRADTVQLGSTRKLLFGDETMKESYRSDPII